MRRASTGKDSFLYFIYEQAKHYLQNCSYNTVDPEGTPIVFHPQKHMLVPGISCFPGGRGWFK